MTENTKQVTARIEVEVTFEALGDLPDDHLQEIAIITLEQKAKYEDFDVHRVKVEAE